MLDRFLNFFKDPDDNNPSFIRLTRNILIFVIVAIAGILILVTGIVPGTTQNVPAIFVLIAILALEMISLNLVSHQKPAMAKFVVPIAFLAAITYITITGSGLHDTSIFAFPVVIVVSALLLGTRARYTSTPLTILAVVMIAAADMTGINKSAFAEKTDIGDILISSILVLASAEILQLLIRRLNENVQQVRASEQSQIESNRELRDLQTTLEQRVTERTMELAQANERNERRARQFEAIAEVVRASTSIQDETELLRHLVQVISDQFGFYHVGIFLLDEERQNAVLRAANSTGGRRMLERGHKLKVGQIGIVGYVTASGNPRIALDVGADAAFFDNPDLPDTHSELALPIRISDEVVGALDVQSTEANAFHQEDAGVLATLTDQIAIAIQNARFFETTQELLQEAQKASGSYLKESWLSLKDEQTQIGYFASKDDLKPLQKGIISEHIKKAVNEKITVAESGKTATLSVPIRLRDDVIGVMDIRVPEEHEWDPDEVDIVEAVADRLSLAIESSLLLRTTQRRAEIERLTADISGKISSTTQFDSILRTAAEELSRVLGGSEVLVQIQPLELFGDSGNS